MEIKQQTCQSRQVVGSRHGKTPNFVPRNESRFMKKCIYLLAVFGLFAACEQKTTVNPPGDKKESNTTIVNPPSEKKETNTTVVNPPGRKENTSTKTDINVNTSPSP